MHGAYYMHTGEVFTTTPSCDATIDQAAMTYMRSAKCAAGLVKHHNLEQRVQWRSMLFGRLARAAAKPAGACLRAILVGVARMLATQIHSLDALSSESFKTLASNFDESKTLDTKNFLKKLPLVVLTATRTRACGYIGPSRVSRP